MQEARRPSIIIYGPTASGKSALALAMARRFGGVIINADSMQLYRELRVLTARPTPQDEAEQPHALYGVRPAAEPSNAAWWRAAALAEMERAAAASRLPILCGGTGLYLLALTKGLAAIPDPPGWARSEARELVREIGPEALHARLSAADPLSAARLDPADAQRVARAWEVWRGTGKGIAEWQSAPASPPSGWRFLAVALDPERATLRAAIADRFDAMLARGAVEEVRALRAMRLDPELPVMRAHGVREIGAYLEGRATLEEARRRTLLATGQYTKRQATWLRHQTLTQSGPVLRIASREGGSAQLYSSLWPEIGNFLRPVG